VGLERGQKRRDPFDQGVVDDSLVLKSLDIMLALLSLLVDLVLLGTDKGALVDIWVNLNIGIVAELQRILREASGERSILILFGRGRGRWGTVRRV
jgi:hypothetical protein